jgi:hypothetical protein
MAHQAISDSRHVQEQADGYRWFFIVGLIAVAFSVFLATVDKRLSESDSEKRLGETLRVLRTAQASLPARVTDSRQTMPFMHSVTKSENAGGESH